jgi:hypothetical protein
MNRELPHLIAVRKVQHLDTCRLRLTFNDGAVKDVDLAAELWGEVFEPLKDLAFFAQVSIPPGAPSIEWPNGASFAPEWLYEVGEDVPIRQPA